MDFDEFKVGGYIKKPNGISHFEILRIVSRSRYGNILVKNLMTGRKYLTYSTDNWVIVNPFVPKKISRKILNFNFEHGI